MKQNFFISGILIVFVLGVYWPVCSFGFVWDDATNIYKNPYLNPVTFQNALQFWQKPYANLYIPVTYSFWALTAQLTEFFTTKNFGASLGPNMFHAVNLILHLLNVLLVFTILRLLVNFRLPLSNSNSKVWAAGSGALLFALHPIQVEPVAWITGMKDLLCGFFSMIVIWQYLVYRTENHSFNSPDSELKSFPLASHFSFTNPHYLISSLAFVLALLAKPAGVSVILIIFILDHYIVKKTLKDSAVSLLGWVVIALPYLIFTKFLQPDIDIRFNVPFWARPFIAGDALVFYIQKVMFPVRLCLEYGRSPELMLQHGWVYLAWILPCLVVIFIYKQKESTPYIAASAVFLLGVLPALGFVPFNFQNYSTVSDRYLYISMLGPSLALTWFIVENRNKIVTLTCLISLFLLGSLSASQIWNWRNSFTVFEHVLKINKNSYVSHNKLGIIFGSRGKNAEAGYHFSEAVRIKPDYIKAHFNLAVTFEQLGKTDKAVAHYKKTLALIPIFPEAATKLAFIFATHENPEYRNAAEAIRLAEKAFQDTRTNKHIVLDTLAAAYAEAGKFNKAIITAKKALKFAELAENISLVKDIKHRIRLYETNRPFRFSLNEIRNNHVKGK